MIQNETTYETIKRMKSTNEWDFCLAHFDRAWTLDFYFRLYELVIKYYPKRKYGYATKAVANPLIINELGGVFADFEKTRRPRTAYSTPSRASHGRKMDTLIDILVTITQVVGFIAVEILGICIFGKCMELIGLFRNPEDED